MYSMQYMKSSITQIFPLTEHLIFNIEHNFKKAVRLMELWKIFLDRRYFLPAVTRISDFSSQFDEFLVKVFREDIVIAWKIKKKERIEIWNEECADQT